MAKPVPYGVESWFDVLCQVWGTIVVNKKPVKSYLMREIPESVKQFPCAITFLNPVKPSYSLGGGAVVVYEGTTEFHLTGNLLRSQMGFVMQFPDKIIAAAAKNLTLGGRVTDFRITRNASLEINELTWGSETPHFGISVPWTVEENQSGKFTVSA